MDRQHPVISNQDRSPHYCGHCLTPITARTPSCPSCDISFAGSGRFQRLPGTPPRASGIRLQDLAA